jgi:hypothetical protein
MLVYENWKIAQNSANNRKFARFLDGFGGNAFHAFRGCRTSFRQQL